METKTINKLIFEKGEKTYVLEDGGLTPGVPIPADTVNTDSIIDGAVQEQDLNDSVKDRMTITHDSSTGGLRLGGYAQAGEVNK
jgi:hypothetical protein